MIKWKGGITLVAPDEEILHELLKHLYGTFYFTHPKNRETALILHEMGYFDDEKGQTTQKGQDYFDNLYLSVKKKLVRELRTNRNKTYNELTCSLGFKENTLYLHYFMKKLQREKVLFYTEFDDFNSSLKYIFC